MARNISGGVIGVRCVAGCGRIVDEEAYDVRESIRKVLFPDADPMIPTRCATCLRSMWPVESSPRQSSEPEKGNGT